MRQLQQESPVVAEHAGAGDGSLQGPMATAVQEIDRDAAKRVAGVLAVDEGEEQELRNAERARIESRPVPRGAWGPRILAAGTLAGVVSAALLLSGKPAHEGPHGGSLGWTDGTRRSRAAVPTEMPSMKSSIQRLSTVASIAGAVTTAATAQQAVQWRVQDGGNGHWYAFDSTLVSWQGARAIARARGGELASLTSAAERLFWMSMIPVGAGIPGCAGCAWLGGYQDRTAPDYAEPAGGWRWTDGSPWSYTFWNPGEPNNLNGQDYLYGSGPTNGRWDDSDGSCCGPFVIEWSADCNGDGLVDYGQILSGQLADSDNDGIPNACECTCDVFRDGSVNGIDLGVLLGQWGPANQYTVTDFNGDGAVDGLDLGALLAAWGPCPG